MKRRVLTTLIILFLLCGVPLGLWFWGGARRGGADSARNDVQTVLSPVVRLAEWAARGVSNGLEYLVATGQIRRENEVLNEQVTGFRAENDALRDALRKFERLGSASALEQVDEWVTISADVVAYGGHNWARGLTINQGSRDGVAEGDPVLHLNGLAGVVIQTAPWTSSVQLLSDKRSVVAVTVELRGGAAPGEAAPRAQGTVRGTGRVDLLEVIVQDPRVPVAPGDRVFTSGVQGSLYPRGLAVGTIAGVGKEDGLGQTMADVKPLAVPGEIEEVLVLRIPQHEPAAAGEAPPAPTAGAPPELPEARTEAR